MPALRNLMVAVDGSPSSEFALELASSLALATGASIEVVSVVPMHVYYSNYVPDAATVTAAEEKVVHDRLEKDIEKLRAKGLRDVRFTVLSGLVVEALLDHVQVHPPDLLIMGSRGQSTTRRLLLGSVSDALVHFAGCPVLVAKLPPTPAKA